MSYGALADIVVVVHFAFVVFVVVGGLIALRWPKVWWAHAPAVAWSALIVTFSITCPLTPLERELRARAGEGRYEESFIERYVEGVLYPGDMLREAQALGALLVIASWVALAIRFHRRRHHRRVADDAPDAPDAEDTEDAEDAEDTEVRAGGS